MIQIDDAGSGSLLGGTIIGIVRVETGEYEFDTIPLEYYRDDYFKQKEYICYVITIVKKLFHKINVTTEEKIEVCRGYMFDKLKIWLEENNYTYVCTQIQEPLQSLVEKSFEEYAISLGLPQSFIAYTKYPFHFHRILKWVYADFENRSLLCKTGWDSWQKYGNLPIEIEEEIVKKSNLFCFKCNEILQQGTRAKVKKFNSTHLNKIFLHSNCL
ncbi:hypothetical protein [Alkaliphilus oremlandii]|uniref:Uncharacterized protein n=1 Tax=Alkaliphilus oremlandii (strain OhILAs) TaxID=350688 RepID=A8MFF3_ALKOO|nr:hypothetical protein [Alkaliphilus oremlandii]ABW19116.1 conserved hypothetical protein [Alkaliphilus oremlandii OhILAs]